MSALGRPPAVYRAFVTLPSAKRGHPDFPILVTSHYGSVRMFHATTEVLRALPWHVAVECRDALRQWVERHATIHAELAEVLRPHLDPDVAPCGCAPGHYSSSDVGGIGLRSCILHHENLAFQVDGPGEVPLEVFVAFLKTLEPRVEALRPGTFGLVTGRITGNRGLDVCVAASRLTRHEFEYICPFCNKMAERKHRKSSTIEAGTHTHGVAEGQPRCRGYTSERLAHCRIAATHTIHIFVTRDTIVAALPRRAP